MAQLAKTMWRSMWRRAEMAWRQAKGVAWRERLAKSESERRRKKDGRKKIENIGESESYAAEEMKMAATSWRSVANQ